MLRTVQKTSVLSSAARIRRFHLFENVVAAEEPKRYLGELVERVISTFERLQAKRAILKQEKTAATRTAAASRRASLKASARLKRLRENKRRIEKMHFVMKHRNMPTTKEHRQVEKPPTVYSGGLQVWMQGEEIEITI
uniref:Uncharacterized protein n=1 Tax=Grammatophora oceanica TaxID=210454 RepID=A0A7S1UZN6_9STRA|mmetsp:Transcript_30910/g.45803  ORF Transcript_30910/g.45803 Transcript_30910/m.45803 type:complete len:138 (+) Transcript_30910:223-636(+)